MKCAKFSSFVSDRFAVLSLVFVLLSSSCCCDAFAQEIVTLRMTGTLNEILATDVTGADDTATFQTILPMSIGDTVVATFTYDTSAADVDSRPGYGRYLDQQLSIEVNNTVFMASPIVDVSNDQNGRDSIRAISGGIFDAPGWNWTNAGTTSGREHFRLQDLSQSVFDSEDLPTSNFDEDDFSLLNWQIDYSASNGSSGNSLQTPLGTHIGNRHRIAGTFTTVTVTSIPPVILGDVNMDGVVDFFDIAPFIAVLFSGEFQVEADMDESEFVNFADINLFIEALTL